MKPSSSTSDGLFAGMFARGAVAAEVTDRAWLQAMLDAEAALARALARAGLIPADAANKITAACRADRFDVTVLGRGTGEAGTPVPALVEALTRSVPPEAAGHVHRGATSQDIVDSAMMLVAHRALAPLLDDLAAAADACAHLAERHRTTLMIGRTLLQPALPITFGLKAATCLAALDEARSTLAEVRATKLAAQLGGAAGTLASLGDDGLTVAAYFAAELGLAEPEMPWHTLRLRPALLAAIVGVTAGVLAKIARDIILLAQAEIGEVTESPVAGRGGSSTLPQKRNSVAAVAVVACAERVPGLVATMLAAMPQEQERGAGAWQAEWETLSELLRLTGSAAAWLRELLAGLEIHGDRMRANLDASGDLLLAEAVTTALTAVLGRAAAHELTQNAARRALAEQWPFRDVLLEIPEVHDQLGVAGLEAALAPENYLGATQRFIDRVLERHTHTSESVTNLTLDHLKEAP